MLNFGYESIGHLVIDKAERNGDRTLLRFGDTRVSYRDFNLLTNRVAHSFRALGIGKDSRVAIVLWNDLWPMVVWVALAKLGAWSVFVNPHYKGASLEVLIAKADPDALIVAADVLDNVLGTEAGRAVKLLLVHGETGGTRLSELADNADSSDVSAVRSPGEVAGLIHTSGTTGTPKYCLLSHNYYLSLGMIRMRQLAPSPDDVFYLPMPLYHSHKHLMGPMVADAAMAISARFSVSRFWTEVADYEATILLLHDQPMVMLLNAPPGPADRAHRARVTHPGFRRHREFHDRFGVDVANMIGSNESQSIALSCRYRSHADPAYYTEEQPGLEIMHDVVDVRIVDTDGTDVPPGKSGEILSRQKHPHTRFEGYYNDKAATDRAFYGDWYRHGDLGRIDDRGLLHFIGRKADSIRHRGEWIPQEIVEDAATSHPAVAAAALVGVGTDLGDEDLKLFVEPAAGACDPAELLDHIAARVPYFMVPRYVQLIDGLPRTPGLEKITRRALSTDVEDAWDRERAGYVVRR
ncbi:MAG TPA: AMP-binding protein [Actinophytocola sp.]|jgi:crotonobetaine/carnitine-CoA ligase|nr:AMP-binding protein [Actinophytocola sp.]